MELGFDCAEVGKDVRVVELQVVQNGRSGAVMHKFGALVEKSGVVLVCLDHEKRRRAIRRQARRDAEIRRHPADQKSRRQPRVLEDPGEDGAGRGLAMGAGHRDHPLVAQHVLVQPLRSRGIGEATVENGLHQRVAPRQRIADEKYVGAPRHAIELSRVPARGEHDAEALELGAHGRIDVGVAPAHPVSRRLGEGGDPAHEGPANTKNVQMHGRSANATEGAARGHCRDEDEDGQDHGDRDRRHGPCRAREPGRHNRGVRDQRAGERASQQPEAVQQVVEGCFQGCPRKRRRHSTRLRMIHGTAGRLPPPSRRARQKGAPAMPRRCLA